ncbi:dynein heavy chain, partial [Kipferlia bialata]|eukprot:g14270.t1
MSARYQQELQRTNHVTPTSYLELIATLKTLLAQQYKEVVGNKRRFEIGLDKLLTTAEKVKDMEVELVELQPHLIKTSEQVAVMMVQIEKDKAEADATAKVVQAEEAAASKKGKECQEIADDAERDLAEALPALASAVKSLQSLNVGDLTEMGRYANPPVAVKMVVEAVCIFFEIKPKREADPDKPGKSIDNYWEPA